MSKPKQGKRNIKYRQYFHTNIGISHTGWYTQAIARVFTFPLTLAPLGVDLKVLRKSCGVCVKQKDDYMRETYPVLYVFQVCSPQNLLCRQSGQQGHLRLSLLTHRVTTDYSIQGQPDNLFGRNHIEQKNKARQHGEPCSYCVKR